VPNKRNQVAKRKAPLEHKHRPAKHGIKKIKFTSSTIWEALSIPAKKPREPKVIKPLTHRMEVLAVSASVADVAKNRASKQPKLPRSVELKRSGTFQETSAVCEISPTVVLEPQIAKKKRKKGVGHRSPPYDGQPRFEGGFRIVQAGSFERGKRR
jgi:hypothetical protein